MNLNIPVPSSMKNQKTQAGRAYPEGPAVNFSFPILYIRQIYAPMGEEELAGGVFQIEFGTGT